MNILMSLTINGIFIAYIAHINTLNMHCVQFDFSIFVQKKKRMNGSK